MVSQRDLVLVPWPFWNTTGTKVRLVIVISNEKYNTSFDDFIGVAVTSNTELRDHTIPLTDSELETGKMKVQSVIKVDYISSMDQSLVQKKIGRITKQSFANIIKELMLILNEQ